ncbi:MAG: S-methyl-5'-thioadenosine phosphorylase [Sphingobium sp.]|uniref:S-methyl-5'-thioadenosine phosphorylase n=1 Tax=Sphingobium sp. TaxID=1912891 RepID=UPI0029B2E003|nr:S-methyl-5'-thioadenosine phosphorylase [Sphingobium sp.]MDX3909161.1 S-methyl-5'-thioadenosine phosphorylase [Sphingobium sp.]
MSEWTIGIIGGSGLYRIDGLEDAHWTPVTTPWGKPSDDLLVGRIAGVRCIFLPRHGRGHYLAPGDLNSRANIDAMKRLGATDILSISAVGSLREDLPPGHFAVVDQFIDRTFARTKSFFGKGLVAHVSMADPVCPRLSDLVTQAALAVGAPVTTGATYLAMEGPQFSTRAESLMYRQWGCDVIGMTAMPEAKLAREAELPYALVGMVTDYDCWREEEAGVEVTNVLRVLNENAARARQLVLEFIARLPAERAPSPIDTCLDHAIITAPEARDPEMIARLDAVAGRIWA